MLSSPTFSALYLVIFLLLLAGWQPTKADKLQGQKPSLGYVSIDLEWDDFLGEDVDHQCFNSCWERWLRKEHEVSKAGLLLRQSPRDVSWHSLLNHTSEQYCERLSDARAFQRCYISQCGGLFAKQPAVNDEWTDIDDPDSSELKVWAWVSNSVTQYGVGPSSFGDFDRLIEVYYWWFFPVGLTAACELAPGKVFSSDLDDSKLLEIMNIWSGDRRVPVSQGLRRYLMPMWTSPNLLRYWSYKLEYGTIPGARSVKSLRNKIIGPYLFAAIAYSHLISITSASTAFLIEATRFAAFCLNPLVPTIQIAHNLVDAVVHVLSDEAFEKSYLLASVCGTVLYDCGVPQGESLRARLLEIDVIDLAPTTKARDAKWWIRLIAIIVNIMFIIYSTLPYFLRLAYTFNGATYTAATGFDHRLGWVGSSALIPLLATLAVHLLNRTWVLRQGAQPNRNTEDWKARLALDLAAATVVLELLIMLTTRITVIQICVNRVMQDKLAIIIPALITLSIILATAWTPLARAYRNPRRWLHKVMPWVFLILSCGYAMLVFLLQIFMDMEELADLALDFVLPWNHRWQIPNPDWLEWW
ncbi:hypothetical protein DE146DRAFT_173904 [Phaeosphaeria sp. MPI-PUGE-AT-0046c]|nr:hypothetical protein DE146DRAFT_173904 [Phaeosphaeria sp. MPI-PUGE-AT-0046c]